MWVEAELHHARSTAPPRRGRSAVPRPPARRAAWRRTPCGDGQVVGQPQGATGDVLGRLSLLMAARCPTAPRGRQRVRRGSVDRGRGAAYGGGVVHVEQLCDGVVPGAVGDGVACLRLPARSAGRGWRPTGRRPGRRPCCPGRCRPAARCARGGRPRRRCRRRRPRPAPRWRGPRARTARRPPSSAAGRGRRRWPGRWPVRGCSRGGSPWRRRSGAGRRRGRRRCHEPDAGQPGHRGQPAEHLPLLEGSHVADDQLSAVGGVLPGPAVVQRLVTQAGVVVVQVDPGLPRARVQHQRWVRRAARPPRRP